MNVRPTPRFDAAMIPARMRMRPVDPRGYPVPWFVTTKDANGNPEFRVVEAERVAEAVRTERCWLCGERLGKYLSFLIGPMCAVTRTIAEPPQHKECSEFAARACPFMILPGARRREAGLPDERRWSETGLKRNPGACCVWTTTEFRPFRSGRETLFSLGEPTSTTWWARGEPAAFADVDESIRTGLPHLYEMADKDPFPDEAVADLNRRIQAVYDAYLPGWPAPIRAELEHG